MGPSVRSEAGSEHRGKAREALRRAKRGVARIRRRRTARVSLRPHPTRKPARKGGFSLRSGSRGIRTHNLRIKSPMLCQIELATRRDCTCGSSLCEPQMVWQCLDPGQGPVEVIRRPSDDRSTDAVRKRVLPLTAPRGLAIRLVEPDTLEAESTLPRPPRGLVVVALMEVERKHELGIVVMEGPDPSDEEKVGIGICVGEREATSRLVSLAPVHDGAGHPETIADKHWHLVHRPGTDPVDLCVPPPLCVAGNACRMRPRPYLTSHRIGHFDLRAPRHHGSPRNAQFRCDLPVRPASTPQVPRGGSHCRWIPSPHGSNVRLHCDGNHHQ